MGIIKLWPELRSVAIKKRLGELVLVDGVRKKAGCAPYTIGVDISIWFHQVQTSLKDRHTLAGENPELKVIFYKLAHLLSMPLLPLFVFDGPDRPPVKRGRKVIPVPHWLTAKTKVLIDNFGFQWHQAPGEAEAELAQLNQDGVIDAVLTDDVDALLFGARVVIRTFKVSDREVTIYTSKALRESRTHSLSRGGFLLVALFCGGDYNNGMPGWGPKTACALARYGFGDSLLNAVKDSPSGTVAHFLDEWRDAIRSALRNDNQHYLGRKCRRLAKILPNTFPDLRVVMLYVRPVTSWSRGATTTILTAPLILREPQLAELAMFCERHFTWGSTSGILQKFRALVWVGVILRRLLVNAMANIVAGNLESHPLSEDLVCSGLTSTFDILVTKKRPAIGNLIAYKVEIDPALLVAQSKVGIRGERNNEPMPPAAKRPRVSDGPLDLLTIWLPRDVVDIACPELVACFHGDEASKVKTAETSCHGLCNPSIPPSTTVNLALNSETEDTAGPSRLADDVIDLTATDSDGSSDCVEVMTDDDVDYFSEADSDVIDLTSD